MCRLHLPEYMCQIVPFRVEFYFRLIKNLMQSIEMKYFRYPEILKKCSAKSSLTYWKLENNDVRNINKLLVGSKFGLYTAY